MQSICSFIFVAAIFVSQNLLAQQTSQDWKLVLQIKSLNPQADVLQSASVYSDGAAVITVAKFVNGQRDTQTRNFTIPLDDESPFATALQTVAGSARFAQKIGPGVDPCFFKHGNFEITVLGDDKVMHVAESGDCGGQSIHLPDQLKAYVDTLPNALTLLGTAQEVR